MRTVNSAATATLVRRAISRLVVLPVLVAGLWATSPCSAIARHRADVEVFIYVDGEPVNETGETSYHDPIVYDLEGDELGTVDANDNIVNSSDQIIGYIVLR